MWDPRFPDLAAVRLQERRLHAARAANTGGGPGALRRGLGAWLVRLGERLAAPAPARRWTATVAR